MILMDGKKLSDKKIRKYKNRVQKLGSVPHLVMMQIGTNVGSTIYLRNKQRLCHKIGVKSTLIALPTSITFDKLKQRISTLNTDPKVDGILVQFPLPAHLSRRSVALLIDPQKDVDGIHPFNQGLIVTNTRHGGPRPCTPTGVITMLQEYQISLQNQHVVVLGRSNIAGRPLANMLINENATVTQMHSQTPRALRQKLIKEADIIVTATGQRNIIKPSDVKNGVVIIDIGIIRDKNNKIRGDVEYRAFGGKATYITPVPGGVGPMTVATLIGNIIAIKERKG